MKSIDVIAFLHVPSDVRLCVKIHVLFFLASNLGYSRPGKVSHHHTKLLQECRCNSDCL